MSFTTWVRAQDASGQFDVRKGDELRDGVTLVKGYPEHIGMTARPGKPFVNLGTSAAEGYKGLKKQDLIDEIERRNTYATVGEELIEIPSRPSISALVKLLEDDDAAGETAAAEARKAAGLDEPDLDEERERADLLAQIEQLNTDARAAGNAPLIEATDDDSIEDLKALIEVATKTPEQNQPGSTTNEAGAPGQESE